MIGLFQRLAAVSSIAGFVCDARRITFDQPLMILIGDLRFRNTIDGQLSQPLVEYVASRIHKTEIEVDQSIMEISICLRCLPPDIVLVVGRKASWADLPTLLANQQFSIIIRGYEEQTKTYFASVHRTALGAANADRLQNSPPIDPPPDPDGNDHGFTRVADYYGEQPEC